MTYYTHPTKGTTQEGDEFSYHIHKQEKGWEPCEVGHEISTYYGLVRRPVKVEDIPEIREVLLNLGDAIVQRDIKIRQLNEELIHMKEQELVPALHRADCLEQEKAELKEKLRLAVGELEHCKAHFNSHGLEFCEKWVTERLKQIGEIK
jgi:hypothetical protein